MAFPIGAFVAMDLCRKTMREYSEEEEIENENEDFDVYDFEEE